MSSDKDKNKQQGEEKKEGFRQAERGKPGEKDMPEVERRPSKESYRVSPSEIDKDLNEK